MVISGSPLVGIGWWDNYTHLGCACSRCSVLSRSRWPLRQAIGKRVDASDCPAVGGDPAQTACELYDVDGRGLVIGGPDITRYIQSLGTDPISQACPDCPLECEGDACLTD